MLDVEEMSVGSVPERTRIVFRTGKPLIATREELAAEFEGAIGLNSLCVYPLIMRERVLGVFGLESSRRMPSPEMILPFSVRSPIRSRIAVENALAYGEISELKDKLAQENVYLESEIRTNFILKISSATANHCAVSSERSRRSRPPTPPC